MKQLSNLTMSFPRDARGASEPLAYMLNLAILLMFLGASIPFMGQFMSVSAQAQTNQAEAEAQRVAGGLQTVDRLVRSSNSSGTIGRHYELSGRIGNNQYTITIDSKTDGVQRITIETRNQDVKVEARFSTETPIANTTIKGGKIFIVREDGASEITVNSEGR
jgi:hypothetical protein